MTWPAWGASLLLLLAYPLFPHWLDRAQFAPFVVGMVLLGLPHGAMDHLVVPRLTGRRVTAAYLAAFIVGYLALVAAYLALWRLAPQAAFLLFLLISWLHWGQGDAYALTVFLGRAASGSAASRGLIWAVRGALPIFLPVLAFPDYFHAVARGILGWYGGSGWALSAMAREEGFLLLGLMIVAYLLVSWRENGVAGRWAFWTDAGEVGLLLALFTRVSPILAVGVYFCLWHSARHIARLIRADPADAAALRRGQVARCLRRAAWLSVPMTAGALLLLGGLLWAQGRAPISVGSLVYLYLSLIAALTLPHFLLVVWMDWKEELTRGPETGGPA